MTEAPYAIQHSQCRCDEIEREPLFTWDDGMPKESDDPNKPTATYTIPKYFETHVALDYLDLLYRTDSDAALRWACIMAVGVDGWNALRDPAVSPQMFQEIISVILKRIKGAMRSGPKA